MASGQAVPAQAVRYLGLVTHPCLTLLVIGCAIRVAALLIYLATHNWMGEEWEYEVIAQNLWKGRGFVIERYSTLYYALVPPLFPLISFLLHVIGGVGSTYFVLYYTYHIGVALGIIWLTYRLALAWFGRVAALVSGLFVAVEPGLVIYQSYKMDVIALATFLLLAALALLRGVTGTRNLGMAAGLGSVIGLGLLTRLDLIVLIGLLGVWLVSERHDVRSVVKPLAVTLVVSIVFISPWLVRNYWVLGQFVFISSNAGEWLWLGNNDNSVGTPVALDGRSVFEAASSDFKQSVMAGRNELEVNATFMGDALRYVTEDPWRYVRLSLARLWYFWWFTPTYGRQYLEFGYVSQFAYKAVHAVILGLAALGIGLALRAGRQQERQAVLFVLTVSLLLAAIHSLTYVEGRHRLMIQPLLLIFAGVGVQATAGWMSQGMMASVRVSGDGLAGPLARRERQ